MNKLTLVYAATLLLCAGGLWGILHAGSKLSAVADFGGDWKIEATPPGPGDAEQPGSAFTIDQSGRFFRVRFATGRELDLQAVDPPLGTVEGLVRLELAGKQAHVSATVWPENGTLAGKFTVAGPEPAQFVAWRKSKMDRTSDAGNRKP